MILFTIQYAWFLWSFTLLIVWAGIFVSLKRAEERRKMMIVSFWTSLLGLTEPIFVPRYWNPPSLFDLAHRTGFDIESIIFAFAIGGGAVILYDWIFPQKYADMSLTERHSSTHRYHRLALVAAPLTFFILYSATALNPIYSAVIALMAGGLATWLCRPDLKKKMFVSAALFTVLYFVYFQTLLIAYPGYVSEVWNLSALSGVLILGIPLEELMFAFAIGFMWSSIYEHFKWRRA